MSSRLHTVYAQTFHVCSNVGEICNISAYVSICIESRIYSLRKASANPWSFGENAVPLELSTRQARSALELCPEMSSPLSLAVFEP